jgi:FtsH-binding integral membrane protein
MSANRNPLGSNPRRTARWVAIGLWIFSVFCAVKTVFDVMNNDFRWIYLVLMLLSLGLAIVYTLIWRNAKQESVRDEP